MLGELLAKKIIDAGGGKLLAQFSKK